MDRSRPFFVLSGFVINANYYDKIDSYKKIKYFIFKRIVRIVPIFMVTLFLFILSEIFLQQIKVMLSDVLNLKLSENKIINVEYLSIIYNLTLLNGFGINDVRIYNKLSWSVSIEFWTYIIFSILAVYKFYNKYISGLIILGCLYYFKRYHFDSKLI